MSEAEVLEKVELI